MRSLGLGQIVQSNSSRFKPGDTVYGIILWGLSVLEDTSLYNSIDTSLGLPLSIISVLGMTSLTAFLG